MNEQMGEYQGGPGTVDSIEFNVNSLLQNKCVLNECLPLCSGVFRSL